MQAKPLKQAEQSVEQLLRSYQEEFIVLKSRLQNKQQINALEKSKQMQSVRTVMKKVYEGKKKNILKYLTNTVSENKKVAVPQFQSTNMERELVRDRRVRLIEEQRQMGM